MKIDINIDEAEVVDDALEMLRSEIERYENDELVAPFIREGHRILTVIDDLQNKIAKGAESDN